MEGSAPVFRSRSGLAVYDEPDPFPRAWSVIQVERIPNRDALVERVATVPIEHLRKSALVQSQFPAVDQCEGEDRITVHQVRPTHTVLDVDLQCKRMVVLGNTYHHGWVARVDGKNDSTVYEVDGFLQGFAVAGGHHRIDVFYRPSYLYLGAALAATAFVGLLLLGWAGRN